MLLGGKGLVSFQSVEKSDILALGDYITWISPRIHRTISARVLYPTKLRKANNSGKNQRKIELLLAIRSKYPVVWNNPGKKRKKRKTNRDTTFYATTQTQYSTIGHEIFWQKPFNLPSHDFWGG
jgi:hypothetical protein